MNPDIENGLAKYLINPQECYNLMFVISSGGQNASDALAKMDAVPEPIQIPECMIPVYRRIKGKAAGLYGLESKGRSSAEEYERLEKSILYDLESLDMSCQPQSRQTGRISGTMVSSTIRDTFAKAKDPAMKDLAARIRERGTGN